MKALSVCGPWWWYLLQGVKPVENRDWKVAYRGPLVIQASQKILEADRVVAMDMARRAGWTGGVPSPAELHAARGHLVGTVVLADVVERHPSPFFQGRYGWVVTDPVLFREPVRHRGAQGLFDVDDALLPATARPPAAGLQPLDFSGVDLAARVELDVPALRTFMGADMAAATPALAQLPSDPLHRRLF